MKAPQLIRKRVSTAVDWRCLSFWSCSAFHCVGCLSLWMVAKTTSVSVAAAAPSWDKRHVLSFLDKILADSDWLYSMNEVVTRSRPAHEGDSSPQRAGQVSIAIIAKRLLQITAGGLFMYYCVFNVYWLSYFNVPPSILYFHFDIPCPTTGCTRSFLALVDGNIGMSLHYNPFTILYFILIGITLSVLLKIIYRKDPLLLPRWVSSSWLLLLMTSWAYKLIIG